MRIHCRICPVFLLALLFASCSCSGHKEEDGDTEIPIDSLEDDASDDNSDPDAVDLPDLDTIEEVIVDSGHYDSIGCLDSPDLTYDADTWDVVSFAPDRAGRDCGTNCRQVSFAEYDVWMGNYEVWGKYLVANVMSQFSPLVKQAILIDLESLEHYLLVETTEGPSGEIVSWVEVNGSSVLYIYTIDWFDNSLMLFSMEDGSTIKIESATGGYSVNGYTQMYCNYISYEHVYDEYENQLVLIDLNTGDQQIIPTISGWGLEPKIDSGRIAYQDNYGTATNIGVFDIATGSVIWLLEGAWDKFGPSIYGDIVVWNDTRNGGRISNPTNGDIYMVDLSTGEISPVCDHPASQNFASVWGQWVAWADLRNDPLYPNNPTAATERDIYAKNIETGDEIQVSSMAGWEYLPKIFENHVYFLAEDDAGIVSIFEATLE